VDAHVAQHAFVYWPDLNRLDLPICVHECPGNKSQKMWLPQQSLTVSSGGLDAYTTKLLSHQGERASYPSKAIGMRFCLPIGGIGTSSNMTRVKMVIHDEEAFSLIADLFRSWSVFLVAVPLAMCFSYVYLLLLRVNAKMMLICSLVFLITGTAAAAFHCFSVVVEQPSIADDMFGRYTKDAKTVLWWVGIGASSLSMFFLFWGSCVLPRVDKVSAAVKPVVETMSSLQYLLGVIVLEVSLKFLFTVAWIVGASYVFTNGDVSGSHITVAGKPLHGLVRTFHYTHWQVLMILMYSVGYIWGLGSITMVFKFVTCYVVSMWYFTPCRIDLSKIDVKPKMWLSGLTFAVTYHLGSLVFGAAVLALFSILKPLSILLEWFFATTEDVTNPCVEAAVYGCACFNACVKEILGVIHKEALVQLVLQGNDFAPSSSSSMRIIRGAGASRDFNSKGAAAVHGLTLIYQALGVVIAAILGGYFTFRFIGTVGILADPNSQFFLMNRIGITFLAALAAAGTSLIYMGTLDLVSDTLLFCWLLEVEEDTIQHKFAPLHLRELILEDVVDKYKLRYKTKEALGLQEFEGQGMTEARGDFFGMGSEMLSNLRASLPDASAIASRLFGSFLESVGDTANSGQLQRGSDGTFDWIRKKNGIDDRAKRREGAELTQRACEAGFYMFGNEQVPLEFLHSMCSQTRFIRGHDVLGPGSLRSPPKMKVEPDLIAIKVALDCKRRDLRTVLVSAASCYQLGGGFTTGGRHALEESLCMQTTLYTSLNVASNLQGNGGRMPYIPKDAVVLSPTVEVFRSETNDGYRLQRQVEMLDAIISVAMPNKNAEVADSPVDAPESKQEYLALLATKFHAVLAAAAISQAEALVIPDVGCGVFANRPEDIGDSLGREIKLHFARQFKEIYLVGKRAFGEAAIAAATGGGI
jgi:uncharacterized protein (TIGR02452 family)